jgi:hypothetical protein
MCEIGLNNTRTDVYYLYNYTRILYFDSLKIIPKKNNDSVLFNTNYKYNVIKYMGVQRSDKVNIS